MDENSVITSLWIKLNDFDKPSMLSQFEENCVILEIVDITP
jgi:hypothetical protein